MQDLRLGIVGCGAVTENFHLPAIAATAGVSVQLLVDRDLKRATQLSSRYGGRAAADIPEDLRDVDAMIVAVPNHLHADTAIRLMRAGKHVLVEKPMALSTVECKRMMQAAAPGVTLAVGHVRRFYPASMFIKEVLNSGVLGRVIRFQIVEGRVFRWPVLTDSLFRKDLSGGGVFMDIGVHVVDLALWWFGEWARMSYSDDAAGGVEADCELRLEMRSGATGTIALSRLRDLPNVWTIDCERGTIALGPDFGSNVRLSFAGGYTAVEGRATQPGLPVPGSILDAFQAQLADFVESIRCGREPLVNAIEAGRAIELIEHSYGHRQPAEWAWRTLVEQRAQGTAI